MRSVAEFPEQALSWLNLRSDDWPVYPLKRVVESNKSTLSDSTDPDYDIKYVDISCVGLSEGVKKAEELKFENAPSRARRIVRDGDVLVSTVRTYLRAIARIEKAPKNLIASTGFAVLSPQQKLDSTYFGLFCTAHPFVEAIVAQSTGASYPATNASDIVRLPIPVPPLEVQRQIASFIRKKIREIDDLIANKRDLLKLLAEKRSALITRAVTKGPNPNAAMKPTGIDWLGDIPEHWDAIPFKWRCQIRSGQVNPTEEAFAKLPLIAPDFIESGTGILQVPPSAEEQGAISGKYHFAAGTVVYSKIRPLLAKVCISPFEALCSADMYPIEPHSALDSNYIFFQLLSGHFTSFAVMESLRVAMPKVNRETLGAFPILVPPLEEQAEIVAHIKAGIEDIDRSRKLIESAIERLNEYRSAIITKAVTGELQVA